MPAPLVEQLLKRPRVSAVRYRCRADRTDAVVPEVHDGFSLVFVEGGSFGYRVRGRRHELVSGALMVGYEGEEYICSHEHTGAGANDVCLSFTFASSLVDELGGRAAFEMWRRGSVPPTAELMVLGARAASLEAGREVSASLEELGLALAARMLDAHDGKLDAKSRTEPTYADRRRAVRAAEQIAEHSHEELELETLAKDAGLSLFHFLRLFARVTGVTPHQYLVRKRLEHAARLLVGADQPITDIALAVGFNDVSNFVRTFHRAAGVSPRGFRKSRGDQRTAIFSK